MRTYAKIHAIAAARKGGEDALEALLAKPLPPSDLARIPEDRWLAALVQHVFSAGFNWKVIESKWQEFETAFKGFDLDACAMMNDDWLDALLADKAIVRNGAKIVSVRDNAVFLRDLRPMGGVGAVIGGWPATDYIGLLGMLKAKGARLGGSTGPYALRRLKCDGFILSPDVTARLIAEGVIDKPATSKTAQRAVQAAFNTWMDQSGRSLTEISRTLAMSV